MNNSLTIAHVVPIFPRLSETFIVSQVTGTIDRGCDVSIHAFSGSPEYQLHPQVTEYDLLSRTHYPPMRQRGKLGRGVGYVGKLLGLALRRPAALAWPLRLAAAGKHLSPSMLYRLHDLVAGPPPDVVHAHFGYPAGQSAAAIKALGAVRRPLVVTFYGNDVTGHPQRAGRDCYAHLFQHADRVLALSENMRSNLIDLGGPAEKVFVHHLGVDPQRFAFRPRQLEADRAVRLITVGRFVEKKGLDDAVRAVAHAVKAGRRIEYRVIGDGPDLADIEKLIAELGVADQVRLLGAQTHDVVAEQLDAADLFCLPSRVAADGDQEGTPTVILEASAKGLPVLSTFHAGIPEQVIDGRTGLLVPERSPEKLGEKLIELIDHPQRWAEMGRAGGAHIEAHFDGDKLNDRLVEHYHGVATVD